MFTNHIGYLACALVFLVREKVSRAKPKPSNCLGHFVPDKIRRLNKAISTAIDEEIPAFDLHQTQRSLKDHNVEVEQMTMYLVGHLPEDITGYFLTNSLTDLQDEIDDTVRKFKKLHYETNQHTDSLESSKI